MANRVRGEVDVELGGDKYILRLDHDAIANLEDALGYGLLGLAKRLAEEKAGYREIVAIVHSALPPEARHSMSREAVGKAILAKGLFKFVPVAAGLIGPVMSGGIGLEQEEDSHVKKPPKAK